MLPHGDDVEAHLVGENCLLQNLADRRRVRDDRAVVPPWQVLSSRFLQWEPGPGLLPVRQKSYFTVVILASSLIPLVKAPDVIKLISVPLFTGIIGWVTNWTGVLMLFSPVQFKGVGIPGLRTLRYFLPRMVLEVPLGLQLGKFGWQGIIPSRAAKLGSIAVDTGLLKLGSQEEFYNELDPDAIADHIAATSRDEIHAVVDRIIRRKYPRVWAGMPDRVREAVHARVDQQIPEVLHQVTHALGPNIDQLLDVKLMVIRHLETDPVLACWIFDQIGHRELKLITHLGFVFGFILGLPLLAITVVFPAWWIVPVLGALIGYVTNYLAIAVIFEPAEPRGIGPFTFQGLFIRRQAEASKIWADVIADKVVTMQNVVTELFEGPSGDRTRKLIETYMHPAVERAMGIARRPVKAVIGARSYEEMSSTVISHAADLAHQALMDNEFDRRQAENIRVLVADRTTRLPPADFAEMLRSVIKDDEWLLVLHGAALGIVAGLLHLLIFGA
jgi:uncharacterized membrane protein YheB (UPF0754 family)